MLSANLLIFKLVQKIKTIELIWNEGLCISNDNKSPLWYEHGSVTSRLFRILIDQTTNQPTDEHEGS